MSRFLRDFSISTQLLTMGSLVLAALLIIAGVGVVSLHSVAGRFEAIINHELEGQALALQIQSELLEVRRDEKDVVINFGDPVSRMNISRNGKTPSPMCERPARRSRPSCRPETGKSTNCR